MKSNNEVMDLVNALNSKESKLLKRVASDISKSSRQRREVNLSRIDRFTKENEIIIVPGKVLGGGDLNHKITISALKFSTSALDKLKRNGSTVVPLNELTKESVVGKKVRIIG